MGLTPEISSGRVSSGRVPFGVYALVGAAVLHLAIPVAAGIAPEFDLGWGASRV